MLISLAEYAKRHGKDPASVRQKVLRGGFETARKIGRNWVIEESEPYTDNREKKKEWEHATETVDFELC